MEEPRFAVLDVVEIADHPTVTDRDLVGRRGIVTGIRRHEDGRYTYSIDTFAENSDVGGLYPEDWLIATGERASADLFRVPGPFRVREVVRIASDYEFSEAAGRTGIVTGASYEDPETGELDLHVWVEEAGEVFSIDPAKLMPTGDRVPPEPRGRRSYRMTTGNDGKLRATESFVVIVDELDQYL